MKGAGIEHPQALTLTMLLLHIFKNFFCAYFKTFFLITDRICFQSNQPRSNNFYWDERYRLCRCCDTEKSPRKYLKNKLTLSISNAPFLFILFRLLCFFLKSLFKVRGKVCVIFELQNRATCCDVINRTTNFKFIFLLL